MKKKVVMLMCIMVMVCSLSACGGKDEGSAGSDSAGKNTDTSTPEPEAEKIKGTTGSWGIYSEILVPDGMNLTTGTTTNAEDENAVWVKKADNAMNYFYFVLSTEEQSQKDVAATIEKNQTYNPEEVTLKAGDLEWKGVGYNYLGSDVAQMYAVIGDKVINVRMAGFAYNSDYATAILGSIKLK